MFSTNINSNTIVNKGYKKQTNIFFRTTKENTHNMTTVDNLGMLVGRRIWTRDLSHNSRRANH